MWTPFIGNPEVSKTCRDRIAREKKFEKPADYLISLVNDEYKEKIFELGRDRWDTKMMLGGEEELRNLTDEYIFTTNEVLKKQILSWMGNLKWHVKVDWLSCANRALFPNNRKLDIYWEHKDYTIPEEIHEDVIFKENESDVYGNIKKFIKHYEESRTAKRSTSRGSKRLSNVRRKKRKALVSNKPKAHIDCEQDRRYIRLFGVPAPKKFKKN